VLKSHIRCVSAFVWVAIFCLQFASQANARAAASAAAAALKGSVISQEEGPMQGVLVSAKRAGSTVTVTAVTNEKGEYEFPASRLDSGFYSLTIRAVGYALASPSAAELSHGKTATIDLKLRKATKDEEASQLTNLEWLESFPGTTEQRASVQPCTHCHTLERPARSMFDAEQFFPLINRMLAYPASSFPLMPQARLVDRRGGGPMSPQQKEAQQAARHKLAEYLATVNLSTTAEWKYPFKTLPRPTGAATKVIITEYALPKATRQPHDVVVDPHGMIWYASFGEQILGKLDPKTGQVTEYTAPMPKPDAGTGTLALRCDKEGNLWMGMISQGALAKFDPKPEKFQTWMLPPDQDTDYREFDNIATENHDVDNKVWLIESGTFTVLRLDLATGKFESFEPFPIPRPNIYDIASDSHNNAYFTVFGDDRIGRIDAKTGAITFYKTPTPKSGPRRIKMDADDRAWFSENRGDKIGMFDTKTNEFKEWPAKTPGTYPYSAVGDKYGHAWAGNEYTDRVLRVNTKTGDSVEYLLPRHTNMRSATVDNSTDPATFWLGNNHGASIVKVEPLP
jgi:streptogramin lyase